MRVATLLLVFAILSSFLAPFVFAAESKRDKDARGCRKEGDAAVAAAKLKHPLDATKVKRDAFNKCMSARTAPKK